MIHIEKHNQDRIISGGWTFGYKEIFEDGEHEFRTFYKNGKPYMIQASEEGAEHVREEIEQRINKPRQE